MSQKYTTILRKGIMACDKWLENPIKGLMLDISGVLKDNDVPIPGSVEAIKRLQTANVPFKLVTNETSHSTKNLLRNLNSMGYNVKIGDILSPVPTVAKILKEKNLRPLLLIHPDVICELDDIDCSNPNCVVIADAAQHFQYETLNECFRLLMDLKNPVLFSLGQGKYFRDDNKLTLDVGAFCKALEYATDVKAINVGKPSPEYFGAALSQLGLQLSEVVMIGDDVMFDVGGAQSCGLRGVLVRTGKYRKDRDEPHGTVVPDGIVDNLEEAVNLILNQRN